MHNTASSPARTHRGVIKKKAALLAASALTFGLAACSSDDSGNAIVYVNGTEPQRLLIPGDTSENGGGRIVDMLYSGLVYYDANGIVHNELAESIDLEGDKTYKVTLKPDKKFADGTPVKASNFVDAWNHVVANDQMTESFFAPIEGYSEDATELSGLKVLDDRTFTITLNQPEADFPTRLGYNAFFPLPDNAYDDEEAFGRNPNGNGPYKLEAWDGSQSILLVPNENYDGPRKPKNDGVMFTFYARPDAAYADLLSDNLDVLDAIPTGSLANYKDELPGRSVSQPVATYQELSLPEREAHFAGEEGRLRRKALSMSIDRDSVTNKLFYGTRTPATDFTSPVIDGYDPNLKGNEVLMYNPEEAKKLWAQADAISPYDGTLEIAYDVDGGHQEWVDAVANQIRNNLGIEAVGRPYPDFKSYRNDIKSKTIKGAFRTGWFADYPGLGNFLVPNFVSTSSSNDSGYNNPEFDALMTKAAGQPTPEESNKLYNEGQEIMLQDLPAIPLWYPNVVGGWSNNVDNVTFNWKSLPEYYAITKN